MFKFRLLAASAAVAMGLGLAPSIQTSPDGGVEITTMTSAAQADKGHKGDRVWVTASSLEDAATQIKGILSRGDEACIGSSRNHTCYSFDPMVMTLHRQQVSRPIGANKNVVTNSDIAYQDGYVVMRTEGGAPVVLFQVASENANWQSTMQQMVGNLLPAALNGVGAAGVQAAFSPCGGGRCGGQGVVNVVTANSGSVAQSNAALNAVLSGSGCGTGACTPPPTPPPGH